MLDNQAFGQQFGIDIAYQQLGELFSANFSANLQNFSTTQADFHLRQPFFGQLAINWLDKAQFKIIRDQNDFIVIDGQKQPLATVNHHLQPWLVFLAICQIAGIDVVNDLKALQPIFQQLQPSVPVSSNQAKQLANFLNGKISLILTSQTYQTTGEWWRYCSEQYARNLCFYQDIKQLNLTAWTGHPVDKPFGVIDIISDFDDQQTKQLFEQKNRFLSGFMPASHLIRLQTATQFQQLLEIMLIAQMTCFYLAVLQQQSLR